MEAFGDWNVILTKAGHVVYTVAQSSHGAHEPNAEEKRRFDLVHLAKIDASDAIVVLNVDGYIGESTLREIEWARLRRKDVYWLNHAIPGQVLGVSIWQIYNLFEDRPIRSMSETVKYGEGKRTLNHD